MLTLDGATAMVPMDIIAFTPSNTGAHDVPPLVLFHTPPVALCHPELVGLASPTADGDIVDAPAYARRADAAPAQFGQKRGGESRARRQGSRARDGTLGGRQKNREQG